MKSKKMAALCAVVMSLSIVATACGPKASPAVSKPKGGLEAHTTEIIKAEHPEKNPELAKNRKDTLVVGVDTPDGVFNPLYAESSYDIYINEAIFDPLLDMDAEGNPIPGIAEKWEISDDGLNYTFHLKKGVKFSDGTPVTADDIEFSYYVLLDPSYDGPMDAISMAIKGWEAYNKGTATTVEGIKVIDPQTIKFTLDKPNASTIYGFTSYSGHIMSKAYYGKDYKKGNTDSIKALNRKPMGCGAYKLVSYKEGVEADLVANENYWKGAPKIKNLIYKATNEQTRIQMLTSGETDIDEVTVNTKNVQQLKDAGFLNIQMYPTNGYGYIGMNVALPQFSDKKVRQALAYGLNRKQIVDTVYKGYADVCNEPQSKVSWAFNPDVNKYEFDTNKANQLLDEAGWKKGADGIREKDGKKFEIHFSASSPNPVNDAIIPIAKDNYAKLGINFIPEQMEFNAVRKKVSEGKAEMFFMAWGLNADPDCTTLFKTKGSQNKLNYSNPKVDELLDKGLQTTKLEDRKKIYQDLWKELNDDLPYIFMYQRRDMWPINTRIKNINATPYRDFTYDLWKAEIQ